MDKTMEEKRALDKDMWGWVVCFGTVITFIAGIGHVNSFGLIYNDFMTDTNSSAKSLTTAHGTFAIMLAIGGIILTVLSKKFTLRLGGFMGAIIMIFGSLSNVFITNTNQLSVTFGILQGMGFGMMAPVCYSTINHYFVKKRTTVMSVCKALQGLTMVWYPHLLKKIMSFYGFRGTLLILSAISLHTLPGMAVMRINTKRSLTRMKTANKIDNVLTKPENIDLLKRKQNDEVINDSIIPNQKKRCNAVRLDLLKILNIKVLNDAVYCNICVGQSFVNFSDLTFFILQPMLLFQYGYNTTQVATCISTCAGADVVGRCALAVISSIFDINTRVLFYISTLFTLVVRLVILRVHQYVWILVLTAALGVLRAWLHVASPLVISDLVSHQDFPGAYALFMLVTGLVNVAFAPVIGLLKDVYDDYVPAFYMLTACCLPCLIFWPVEYFLTRK